jgi:hypothetical protein
MAPEVTSTTHHPTRDLAVGGSFRAQIIATLVVGILLPPLGFVVLLRMRRRADQLPATTGWLVARYAARLETLIAVFVIARLVLVAMNKGLGLG